MAERYVPVYAEVAGTWMVSSWSRRSMELRARKAQTADRRARKLLRAHLTKSQLSSFESRGWIEARGNHTGKAYYIYCASVAGNIYRPDPPAWFCVVIDEPMSRFDHFLSQKLLIEANERKFLRIAVRL